MEKKCKQLQKNSNQEIVSEDFLQPVEKFIKKLLFSTPTYVKRRILSAKLVEDNWTKYCPQPVHWIIFQCIAMRQRLARRVAKCKCFTPSKSFKPNLMFSHSFYPNLTIFLNIYLSIYLPYLWHFANLPMASCSRTSRALIRVQKKSTMTCVSLL